MLRRIAIIPTLMAMLMVMFTTIVPHHHHQAMICLVKEVCVMDGCCDDEHTAHSDAHHDEDESHCISHEKYFPSDDLKVDFTVIPEPAIRIPTPVEITSFSPALSDGSLKASSSPPILTCRINC